MTKFTMERGRFEGLMTKYLQTENGRTFLAAYLRLHPVKAEPVDSARQEQQERFRLTGEGPVTRLGRLGYAVEQFTPYHFRIEGVADFWLPRQKWRFIRTGQSGVGLDSFVRALRSEAN